MSLKIGTKYLLLGFWVSTVYHIYFQCFVTTFSTPSLGLDELKKLVGN